MFRDLRWKKKGKEDGAANDQEGAGEPPKAPETKAKKSESNSSWNYINES